MLLSANIRSILPTTNSNDITHGNSVSAVAAALHGNCVGIAGVLDFPRSSFFGYTPRDLRDARSSLRWLAVHGVQVVSVSIGVPCYYDMNLRLDARLATLIEDVRYNLNDPDSPEEYLWERIDQLVNRYLQAADFDTSGRYNRLRVRHHNINFERNNTIPFQMYNTPIWLEQANNEMRHLLDIGYDFLIAQAANNLSNESVADTVIFSHPDILYRVLTVGGSDINQNMARISAWGGLINVVAPAQSIYSLTTHSSGMSSGNSLATPFTSSVAALAWSLNAGLDAADIVYILIASAEEMGTIISDNREGRNNTYHQIDALAAVSMAARRQPTHKYATLVGYVNSIRTEYACNRCMGNIPTITDTCTCDGTVLLIDGVPTLCIWRCYTKRKC